MFDAQLMANIGDERCFGCAFFAQAMVDSRGGDLVGSARSVGEQEQCKAVRPAGNREAETRFIEAVPFEIGTKTRDRVGVDF